MSIKQKRTMTEKSLAAHRKNRRKSRGPATAAGKEMTRDASLRHGFYSQDRDTALRALGEDPVDFEVLLLAARDKWQPEDGFEERLAMQLARAMWRLERADRMQESYALRQAQEVNSTRESRQHEQMMRLKMTEATLQSLAQSVAREHYVTTPADLALMKNLLPEESMKEMGDIALALFLQLQEPGERDAEGCHIDHEEMSRRALARIQEIFGLAGDTPPVPRMLMVNGQMQPVDPPPVAPPVAAPPPEPVVQEPNLSPEEWEKREPVRQLLENILTRQAELCEAQRTAIRRECLAGPSSFERAAEIAPTHPDALLIQRMRDSSFREVWRLTNLLMKIKQPSPRRGNWGNNGGSRNAPDRGTPTARPDRDPGEGSAPAHVAPTVRSARAGVAPT